MGAWYCLSCVPKPFKIRTKSSTVNCPEQQKQGKRPINSGPFWTSSGDNFLHIGPIFVNRSVILTETTIFTQTLQFTISSIPSKAPPTMKRMFCINLNHSSWCFASTLRWHTRYGSFDNPQESLLNSFTRNITGDRDLPFFSNLVNSST